MQPTVKLTVRLSPRLHEKIRQLSQETRQSVNSVIEAALENGLEKVARYPESDDEKIVRLLRENGLYEPMGDQWEKYAKPKSNMTHAELREMLKDVPPLSEIILEERNSQR